MSWRQVSRRCEQDEQEEQEKDELVEKAEGQQAEGKLEGGKGTEGK